MIICDKAKGRFWEMTLEICFYIYREREFSAPEANWRHILV